MASCHREGASGNRCGVIFTEESVCVLANVLAVTIFRFLHPEFGVRVGGEAVTGRFDLTETFASIAEWLAQPDPIAALKNALATASKPVPNDAKQLAPVDGLTEVWAAGVTYERSKVARMEESEGGGDFYDKVYVADRPELFMKSVAWRVIAPNDPIRVRKDSTWDVPEPELTLAIAASGKVVGVTIGNDVSSRSIEGENPLYLPQAKVYTGSCAIGPAIVVLDTQLDLKSLPIKLEITRKESDGFVGETNTATMKRNADELAGWLFRESDFPGGALLMTGTGIVPPDSFTLKSGDVVTISIGGIGQLINPVA
jgi:2-dehydro-3-deoxy-D-arabinonate dehydratase